MDSSQGLKDSGNFDVLNSQKDDSSFEYKIQIKKVGFENAPKPTELAPFEIPEEKLHKNLKNIVIHKEEIVEIDENFKVPKELLNFLDDLINKKKLPLRTLKFDIEFSKSREEIANYLEEYIEKSRIIPHDDLDKLYGFIGYGRTDGGESEEVPVLEVVSTAVVEEKPGRPQHSRIEEFFNPEGVKREDLAFSRTEYIKTLVPYLEKQKKDKEVYAKLIAELGGESEMPEKDLPKEVKDTQKEYIDAKSKIVLGIEAEVLEIESFRNEFHESFEEKKKNILRKSLSILENSTDKEFLNLILSGDVSEIDKVQKVGVFNGLRAGPPTEMIPVHGKVKIRIGDESGKAPVDIGVAIKEALSQNVISLDWQGKRIEIKHSGEEIEVFLEGKHIAGGFMSPKGPKVRIDSEYKSGFLFADTIEEKALKFASQTLKNLK